MQILSFYMVDLFNVFVLLFKTLCSFWFVFDLHKDSEN